MYHDPGWLTSYQPTGLNSTLGSTKQQQKQKCLWLILQWLLQLLESPCGQRITTPGQAVLEIRRSHTLPVVVPNDMIGRQPLWQLTSCGFRQKMSSGAHPTQGSDPLVIWLGLSRGHLPLLDAYGRYNSVEPYSDWNLADNRVLDVPN